jgi:hypothetical protein
VTWYVMQKPTCICSFMSPSLSSCQDRLPLLSQRRKVAGGGSACGCSSGLEEVTVRRQQLQPLQAVEHETRLALAERHFHPPCTRDGEVCSRRRGL